MPILPDEIRVEVWDYFDQGYSNEEIIEKIRKKAEPYLELTQDLNRCIAAIKGHRSKGHKVKKR